MAPADNTVAKKITGKQIKSLCIFFNFFKYKVLVLNMLANRTAMKSNFKLAPVSCHCKLSELIPHLKNMSVQQTIDSAKGAVILHPATAELLLKRYV
jgi:hypothetical protein